MRIKRNLGITGAACLIMAVPIAAGAIAFSLLTPVVSVTRRASEAIVPGMTMDDASAIIVMERSQRWTGGRCLQVE